MALIVDALKNEDRLCGDNILKFLVYFPVGVFLLVIRIFLALILWIASIILPNKSTVRQMLSNLACWTFGVYVKVKGERDPRCSVLVANYVSCLDSLAASHVLATISLRKWKVPPFFASTLGIRNAMQFIRKQHFGESPNKPILLQPEGGPTNGKGLLKFTDWPFQVGNRAQPVAISVERAFTNVTVHGHGSGGFPWTDALWFMWSPVTVYSVTLLETVERHDDDEALFIRKLREAIATALQVEVTDFRWEELSNIRPARVTAPRREPGISSSHLAARVKEVLPTVPLADIMRDLARTRSVDVTITNFLEGVTPYTPEVPSTSSLPSPSSSPSRAKYVVPAPSGVFARSARERQLSFHEKKAKMIADARQRYIEKHGLDVAVNNC